MSNVRRVMERSFGVIILLLPLLIITAALCGGETDRKTEGESVRKSNFILAINDSFLSLRARDASVKEVLEAIGRRMKIEVVGNIPEEGITVAFDKLTLEDAIKSLTQVQQAKIVSLVIPSGYNFRPSFFGTTSLSFHG